MDHASFFSEATLIEIGVYFDVMLVEQRTGNAEVMGSNPVEALIFFRLLLSNCLNWKIYCDDHSLILYILFTFFPLVTSLLRPKRFLLIYMTTRKPTEASLRFFFFLCFVFLVKIIYFLVIIDFFIQCVIILHFQNV